MLKLFFRGSYFTDIRNRLFSPIRILNSHFEEAGNIITRYGKVQQIHTLNAIQLSVALSIVEPMRIDQFVCADQRLCKIALLEGLRVLNPELS